MGNVPKLRFSEFEREWRQAKLGDYGVLISGLTYSPADIVDEGGLLVLRSSNIQNERMAYDDNVYVGLEVKPDAITQPDDILICVRNGSKRLIGKNALIPEGIPRATHGAFMTVFRGSSNRFIAHWLKSAMYAKQVYVNLGATINSINGSDLKRFKVVFPDGAEQQKIAAFLTAVDAKIEQLTQKEALLKQYKKGVMQKIFSQEIRFKADDGSEFPEWKKRTLGDLGDFYRGHSYDSSNVQSDGLLVLRSSNIQDGKLVLDRDLQFVNKDCADRIVLRDKDIVICMANGSKALVGKSGVYDSSYQAKVTVGAFCSIYRSVSPLAQFILQTYQYQKYLHVLLAGTNINNLKNSDLSDLVFNLPASDAEVTKIVNVLSGIDQKIELVSSLLEAAKTFKKGLLQQMFV